MTRLALLLPLLAVGCDGSLAVNIPSPAEPVPLPANDRFDPAACGTVAGRVRWVGELPDVSPLPISRFLGTMTQKEIVPHPNAPRFSADGGVRTAVVFLRGVDPRRAKSQPATNVRVDVESQGLVVVQDGGRQRVGFVPVGSEVAFANGIDAISGVRARGASFFTLMLPAANDTTRRVLSQPGRVELTSASGQFWAAADIFACEHPYFARTDDAGRFALADVPDGEYELVCWHPNWHARGHERDPETGQMVRMSYLPPVEKRSTVRVVAGKTTTADFTLQPVDLVPSRKP
jgi:hypothetical protein